MVQAPSERRREASSEPGHVDAGTPTSVGSAVQMESTRGCCGPGSKAARADPTHRSCGGGCSLSCDAAVLHCVRAAVCTNSGTRQRRRRTAKFYAKGDVCQSSDGSVRALSSLRPFALSFARARARSRSGARAHDVSAHTRSYLSCARLLSRSLAHAPWFARARSCSSSLALSLTVSPCILCSMKL